MTAHEKLAAAKEQRDELFECLEMWGQGSGAHYGMEFVKIIEVLRNLDLDPVDEAEGGE